ncbi:MAG: WD40 repeat domain-containing protein [Roseibium sp.]
MIVDVDGSVDAALSAPREGMLSGWLHKQRKVQGDGSFIDPVLRLSDDKGIFEKGKRGPGQDVISKLKASFKGARVAKRRLRIVTAVAVTLFAMLVATSWLANTAYRQLIEAVKSNSQASAVAALGLNDSGNMPEALSRAKNALPSESDMIQAHDPLAISAAISVYNGLGTGSSEEMRFHIKDADFDPSGTILATVETDVTEGPRYASHFGRLWSVSTGELISEVSLPKNASFAVEIVSSHRTAIFGGFAGELLIWEFDQSSVEQFPTDRQLSGVSEIVSRGDLDLFAVGASSGVHVFDFTSKQSVGQVFSAYDTGTSGKADHSFDLHPEGRTLAAQINNGAAVIDFINGEILCELIHGQQRFVSLRFSPDGKHLVLMSEDGNIHVSEIRNSSNCSDLLTVQIAAAEGEYLCGRFPPHDVNTAFVDKNPWLLRITQERYHSDDMYCAYLYDWQRQETLSTVLLGRNYAPFAQAFLDSDEPHPAHRDLSHLPRLGVSIATQNLNLFSYPRTSPGGVFLRDKWLRLDPNGVTLAENVSNDVLTIPRAVTSDPTSGSWDCTGYAAGPSKVTVAVSSNGRFVVVVEPLAVHIHDRETCTQIGTWPISMARTAEFVGVDEALLVMNAQRQVFRLPLPAALTDGDLAQRLKKALSSIR